MADPRNKPVARTFTLDTPAVAQGFTITPNTAANWLVRALRFQLVTDANAADRAVMVAIADGTREYRRVPGGAVQAATLTRIYAGSEGIDEAGAVGTFIGIRFPTEGLWLPNGHTLTVSIENVQATDQVSAIVGYRFEFPLGPREHMWPFVPVITEESS